MAIWPFRHFGLKVLSVALAVSLWMVVAGEEVVERGFRVPLELQQFPADLELQADPPSTVDVRVRGASGALSRIAASDIVAELDLRGARVGRRLFHLTPDQVRAPFGVEVVQVNPASLALVFENSRSRVVPIAASVEGHPAPGYVAGKAAVDPATAEIVGPESAVERTEEALTEPVSVEGASDRVRQVVTVGVADSALRVKGPRAAAVTVPVIPAPSERTLRGVAVHLRHLGPNLAADSVPAVVTVTVRGSREGLSRLDPGEIVAFVDLAGLGAGEYPVTAVRAEVSRDVGVIKVEPPTVQVRIASAKK